jgi:hypothetical protein
MLTPDYQEFANRARGGHRDNTVISSFRTRKLSKSHKSCAIATLNQHESGTFFGEIAPKRPPASSKGWRPGILRDALHFQADLHL